MAENMTDLNQHPESDVGPGYETSDVKLRPVVIAGIILTVVVILSVIAMNLMFGFLTNRSASVDQPLPPLANSEQLPPEPRLQVAPAQDLILLRAQEDDILNNYGWVDQEAGVVRIPIDRAKALILERGLPTQEQE